MTHVTIAGFTLYELAGYFLIYSFFGWCSEVIFAALNTGKFVNRGFLNGPVCPIYGSGVVLILVALTPLKRNALLVFAAAAALTTALEFLTGLALEKLFHTKWWDYSGERCNVGGYVCLKFTLLWGLACLLVVYVLHPFVAWLVGVLPVVCGYVLLGLGYAALLFDLVVTVLQIGKLKAHFKQLDKLAEDMRAPSDAIGEKLSEAAIALHGRFDAVAAKIAKTRLYKAFPHLTKRQAKKPPEAGHADDKENKR